MLNPFLVSLRSCLFVILFALPAFSQPGWERTYGGTAGDEGRSVQQTTDDGGYIVAGWTGSFGAGGEDVYLIKTDSLGDTLWTRTYGGPGNEGAYSVQQTKDGGYIIAGYTDSYGSGGTDFYLIKTNKLGDTLWTRTYGGPYEDDAYSVQQTSDGGYIIAGATFSYGAGTDDVYLIKTDSLGDTLWTRTNGGPGYDGAYSVRQTSDSGYILTGWTDSFGHGLLDVYLIKTKANGDTLWTRTYGGTSWDDGKSVQQTSDGGYIVTGGSYSFPYIYLVKTNANGDTLWTRSYAGASGGDGRSVQQTSDGGYIITGMIDNSDVYLIKTNASGDTLWTRSYGGTGDNEGQSVQQTTDGGYIIAGFTNAYGAGSYDVYLIKTDANGRVGAEMQVGSRQKAVGSLKATPNPFVSYTTVQGHEKESFALYDITGREVGTYKGDRIGAGLPAGVYFLRPKGKEVKPMRIVKLR